MHRDLTPEDMQRLSGQLIQGFDDDRYVVLRVVSVPLVADAPAEAQPPDDGRREDRPDC